LLKRNQFSAEVFLSECCFYLTVRSKGLTGRPPPNQRRSHVTQSFPPQLALPSINLVD
jgi:hypothetical protein